ncbi:MAG: DUF58 domain-containing protein, partial [Rubrobacteraceae bacterium]
GVMGRRGVGVAGLRGYRRGAGRRHGVWKSGARTGGLYVKEFALHAPKRYTVALDLRRGGLRALDGPVEDAVSAAASILTHLRREGLPSRLLCTDKEGEATRFAIDDASYWRAMRILAFVRADGDAGLVEAVMEDRASLGEGVVLVSRNLDEDLPECVGKLRSSGLAVVALVIAAHTYRPSGGDRASEREAAFARYAERLERAGAGVCVARYPEGAAGLSRGGIRSAIR